MNNEKLEIINENTKTEKIKVSPFNLEITESYLSYAMSVIVDRALPDARDGLKPVQRRVLYSMNGLGLSPGGQHKKSARIVGETMGKFHPHGDGSIYEAMVRMAQPFSLRVPLVDGQGNFGSIDGDSAAAMRYTEAKMSLSGESIQKDINEDTVDFVSNFDESLKEPSVFPCSFPNLLINGSSGIAVGMAVNIPPHNPVEIISLAVEYIKNNCSWNIEELLNKLPGPDFPTGGEIIDDGFKEMYRTGKGRVIIRGRCHIEETKNRFFLVFTEIPYGVTKERLVEQMINSVNKNSVDGIVQIRDESDKEGCRVVVEMYKRLDPEDVKHLMYSTTQMSTSFGGNFTALVNGVPRVLSLKDCLDIYINHRREITRRRTQFRFDRDSKKLHIIEGLVKVVGDIDKTIQIIKTSKSSKEAKAELVSKMNLSEVQAEAVLDLRLARITVLEKDLLDKERVSLEKLVSLYTKILLSAKQLDNVIISELEEQLRFFKNNDFFSRKTIISKEANKERVKKQDDGTKTSKKISPLTSLPPSLVSIDETGNLRKKDIRKRISTTGEDEIYCSDDIIYAISYDGRIYSREKKGIPNFGSRKACTPEEFFGFESKAKFIFFSPDVYKSVYFVMSDGSTKKMTTKDLIGNTSRKNSSRKIFPLEEEQTLFAVLPELQDDEKSELFFVTRHGRALRVEGSDFRPQGAAGAGIRSINIAEDDALADVLLLQKESEFLILIISNQTAARISLKEMKTTGRGGKGMYIHRGDKAVNGEIVGVLQTKSGECFFGDGRTLPVSGIALREISNHSRISATELSSVAGCDTDKIDRNQVAISEPIEEEQADDMNDEEL